MFSPGAFGRPHVTRLLLTELARDQRGGDDCLDRRHQQEVPRDDGDDQSNREAAPPPHEAAGQDVGRSDAHRHPGDEVREPDRCHTGKEFQPALLGKGRGDDVVVAKVGRDHEPLDAHELSDEQDESPVPRAVHVHNDLQVKYYDSRVVREKLILY